MGNSAFFKVDMMLPMLNCVFFVVVVTVHWIMNFSADPLNLLDHKEVCTMRSTSKL